MAEAAPAPAAAPTTRSPRQTAPLSPQQIAECIESYLAAHPDALLLEDGRTIFDLKTCRCSASESHGRCILELWSEQQNLVRTVIGIEHRRSGLRILTRRLGSTRPQCFELTAPNSLSSDQASSNHRRTRQNPSTTQAARRRYLPLLQRVLERNFADSRLHGLSSAIDLEHSFGPAYARAILTRGQRAEAILGVAPGESAATIDGALTIGLLWLDLCRQNSQTKPEDHPRNPQRHFAGLKLILPRGAAQTVAHRLAWLNHDLASFELFELDHRSEELLPIDFRDFGNLDSHLSHAFDAESALARARPGIDRVLTLLDPGFQIQVELCPRSASEVSLLRHGLEFARVRQVPGQKSFAAQTEITFGAGIHETTLSAGSEDLCRNLLQRLFLERHPDRDQNSALYRLQPEKWLESRIRTQLPNFLPTLNGAFLYAQVPAIASSERGMLDLLTVDTEGRLVILEVKADEDMNLPLQGLDYWIRVHALHADRRTGHNRETGALERAGYFAAASQPENPAEISPLPPRLWMIAPALRIHPSNQIVLRYLSPQVEWQMIAVSEHWRRDLKIIFRKRSGE